MAAFISRRERFVVVGSTNDVVRGWLVEGVPEVCLAVADEQFAGRGRDGRTWIAPAGSALLLSLGFRPTWLAPAQVWQLAASMSVAMATAAESAAGLPAGTILLKWPNDLVAAAQDGGVRKLAGVLGESDGLGTADPRVVVGVGVNVDWAPGAFPPEIAPTMTSLSALAGGGAVDRDDLLEAFLDALGPRIGELRAGRFLADEWTGRQVTTGRDMDLIAPDGAATTVRAIGVDAATGALLVGDHVDGTPRQVLVGEVRHVRLGSSAHSPASASPASASVGV